MTTVSHPAAWPARPRQRPRKEHHFFRGADEIGIDDKGAIAIEEWAGRVTPGRPATRARLAALRSTGATSSTCVATTTDSLPGQVAAHPVTIELISRLHERRGTSGQCALILASQSGRYRKSGRHGPPLLDGLGHHDARSPTWSSVYDRAIRTGAGARWSSRRTPSRKMVKASGDEVRE
jgi:hypothetical protein